MALCRAWTSEECASARAKGGGYGTVRSYVKGSGPLLESATLTVRGEGTGTGPAAGALNLG